ncbi:hypothetical protein [Listeria valentina]|uniref:hypothetical protein n=1 Tax=Listeria valentina TaxID=2705293 RepID=UPI00142FD20B|nr:hypothetical protein [Listeria valentina]
MKKDKALKIVTPIIAGILVLAPTFTANADEAVNHRPKTSLGKAVNKVEIPSNSNEPVPFVIEPELQSRARSAPIIAMGTYNVSKVGMRATMRATGSGKNCKITKVDYRIYINYDNNRRQFVTDTVRQNSPKLNISKSWYYKLPGIYKVKFTGQAYTTRGPAMIVSGAKTIWIPVR